MKRAERLAGLQRNVTSLANWMLGSNPSPEAVEQWRRAAWEIADALSKEKFRINRAQRRGNA